MKKILIGFMMISMILIFWDGSSFLLAAETIIGSYNMIGLEDDEYTLELQAVKRSTAFDLDDQKVSFYMLNGDLTHQDETSYTFIPRIQDLGFKIVFISPEAGRFTGEDYSTKDFYPELNSILRIINAEEVVYEKTSTSWQLRIVDIDQDVELYIEEKDGTRTQLDSIKDIGYTNQDYIIDLENYTLQREASHFEMNHFWAPGSKAAELFGDPKLTFNSDEIMFRTFETRLSETLTENSIVVDRKPSKAIIGQVLRFTGSSDDGDNLAKVESIDEASNRIYVSFVTSSFNTHGDGTWVRAYSDYTNGAIIPNEYPKVLLEPSYWVIDDSIFQNLMDMIVDADPTGLIDDITVDIDDEDSFGYKLAGVSYGNDGLNFIGSLNGAFYITLEFDFFGRGVDVGPIRFDYGGMMSALTNQFLRINTYKKEAFRVNVDPKAIESYADWDMTSFNPPDVFPLIFRLYFDKHLELIGGNLRINLPGSGIPLPGGLVYIDQIGGGYCYPEAYEVSALFQSYEGGYGFPLWNADVDMRLDLDESYLYMEGRSWFFNKKISIGQFDATVAWDYYSGKRFKGVELSGETGVGAYKVNAIIELTFKFKRYKSDGETKTYIGGSGEARVDVFGYTFTNVKISATTQRFRGSVKVPIIGVKSFRIYYEDVVKNITSLSTWEEDVGGVARMIDETGSLVVLVPEAQLVHQSSTVTFLSDVVDNTLDLPTSTIEAAITMDYTGTLDEVSVTLPNGTTMPVEIATDTSVFDSNTLYAMDYDISETERQLYIQIPNASSGTYIVQYGTTEATDISLYTITQIPQIDEDGVSTSLSGDVVTVSWDLEEENLDTKYHITLVELDSEGTIIESIELYENVILDDTDTVIEQYLDSNALTISNTSYSFDMLLPNTFTTGEYAVIVEPVLDNLDTEDYYGTSVQSSTFTFTNTPHIVEPANVTVSSIGNGVAQIGWDYVDDELSWDIVLYDLNGERVDSITITEADISTNNLVSSNRVLVDVSVFGNTDTPYIMTNGVYDESYYIQVISHKEVSQVIGDLYNQAEDYIDITMIEATNNDGYLYYQEASDLVSGLFEEPEIVEIDLSLYEEDSAEPNTSTPLYQEDTTRSTYEYDNEQDTDIEYLRATDYASDVINTNVFDVLELALDQEIHQFSVQIVRDDGSIVIDLPLIDIDTLTTPSNYFTLFTTLNSSSYSFTTEEVSLLIAVILSGAITINQDLELTIDMTVLEDEGIIDALNNARYYITLDVYNTSNDQTTYYKEIVLSDFVPQLFIETMIPADLTYEVTGLVHGASSITINGVTTTVEDGLFTMETVISNQVLTYEFTDLFGNTYSGSYTFTDDLLPPTLLLSSYDNLIFETPEDVVLPTCTVSDNIETGTMCVVEGLPLSFEYGETYQIDYTAVDAYGNESETVTIIVTIMEEPEIPIDPIDLPNEGFDFSTAIGITIGAISIISIGIILLKRFKIL